MITAKLGSFDLKIDGTNDNLPNNLAQYNFPFAKGSQFDFLGENAREISLTTYWMNYNNTGNYSDHYDFLDYIRSGIVFELVHPVYGRFKGRVSDINVRHDEPYACAISFMFKEQKIGEEVQGDFTISMTIANVYVNAQTSLTKQVTLGIPDKTALTKILDKSQNIASQFAGFASAVRAKARQISDAVNTIVAITNTVINAAESIKDSVEFIATLAGVLIEAINNLVAGLIDTYNSIVDLPSNLITSVKIECDKLKETLRGDISDPTVYAQVCSLVDAVASQVVAHQLAIALEKDTDNFNASLQNSQKVKFDKLGNVINDADVNTNILSQQELENSLYLMRQWLDESTIGNPEATTDIQNEIAAKLKLYIDQIKLQRYRIYDVVIEPETNLYNIMKKYSIPEYYYEKLISINAIENPNFIRGDFKVVSV